VQNDSSTTESITGDISIDREQASLNFSPNYSLFVTGTVTMGEGDEIESNDEDEDDEQDEDDSGSGDGRVSLIGFVYSVNSPIQYGIKYDGNYGI
jgi:hypothetical protein